MRPTVGPEKHGGGDAKRLASRTCDDGGQILARGAGNDLSQTNEADNAQFVWVNGNQGESSEYLSDCKSEIKR